MTGNHVYGQLYRGFESHSLRCLRDMIAYQSPIMPIADLLTREITTGKQYAPMVFLKNCILGTSTGTNAQFLISALVADLRLISDTC